VCSRQLLRMTFLTKLRSQVQCKRIWHYNIIYTYIRYNTEQNEKNTVLCKYYIYVYYKYALEDNNPRCNDHHLSVGNLNSIRLNETIRRRTLQIVFFLARPPPSLHLSERLITHHSRRRRRLYVALICTCIQCIRIIMYIGTPNTYLY